MKEFIFYLSRFASITNSTSNTLVSGTSGNDSILNFASKVTLDGGAGKDTISNGQEFFYDSGDSDDDDELDDIFDEEEEYEAKEEYLTSLNLLNNNSINGGADNDVIYNYGPNNTISGGAGNDSIYNFSYYDEDFGDEPYGGNDVVFKYAKGDGNDVITGFNDSSTLEITASSYSTTKSGSDIIVTVDDGKITLVGAAKLDELIIESKEGDVSSDPNLITLTEDNDTYTNRTEGVTIKALGGNDRIYNYSKNVLIDGGADNDIINNGEDFSEDEPNEDDYYDYYYDDFEQYWDDDWSDEDEDSYYDEDEYRYYEDHDGFDEDLYLMALEDYEESHKEYLKNLEYISNNTIIGGAGNDSIYNHAHNNTISGGTGDDFIYSFNYDNYDGDEYGPDNVAFKYSAGDGNDKIYGFNETSTLQIAASSYSTEKSGSDIIVTVGEGKITLFDAAELSKVNIENTTGENSWTLSGTTAKYGTSSKTLATVKDVKSLDGLTLNKNVVTVAKSSLNAQKVTVSDGYKLKLGSDVTTPTTKKAAWSLKSSTATYKGSSKTAGYTLASDGKSITYSKATTAETLATVKGVKSIDGLKVSGKNITVSKASLNAKNVTVSDGYTLKLGSDVTKSTVKNKAWSLKSNTATYKGTATAGYTLASDSKTINYSKKGTVTLATVKGVKSIDGLKLSGTTVTVSNASLNAKKVTISDGYKLALGKDVTKSTAKKAAWTLKSSTATYNQTMTAGYSLEDNTINYSKASTTKTLATVKGVKSTSGLSVKNDVVTLKNSALSSKVTVSGGYEFDFASDYTKSNITGSSNDDIITARGKNITIESGKGDDTIKLISVGLVKGGAGDDYITGGSGNDSLYGEAGNDKLYGGKGNDSLWGGAGNDSLYGDAGNDTFIYKPGEGTDTIFNYQSGDMLTILKSNGKAGGSFTSSSFANGNLTLGISGGGSVVFDGVSKGDTFNINNTTYKISGSKLASSK